MAFRGSRARLEATSGAGEYRRDIAKSVRGRGGAERTRTDDMAIDRSARRVGFGEAGDDTTVQHVSRDGLRRQSPYEDIFAVLAEDCDNALARGPPRIHSIVHGRHAFAFASCVRITFSQHVFAYTLGGGLKTMVWYMKKICTCTRAQCVSRSRHWS